MTPWIEHLIVAVLVSAASALLLWRLFASFGRGKCGCDHCPTKNAKPADAERPPVR